MWYNKKDICEMNNCVIGGTVFPHKENVDITKW